MRHMHQLSQIVDLDRYPLHEPESAAYVAAVDAARPQAKKAWSKKYLELTCVVATQGLQLQKMDPGRDRVLLVNDVIGNASDTRGAARNV